MKQGGASFLHVSFKRFFPGRIIIVEDLHACHATAEKNKCVDVEGDQKAFVKRHLKNSYELLLARTAAKGAMTEGVLIIGNSARVYEPSIRSVVPTSIPVLSYVCHPGFFRFCGDNSQNGDLVALAYVEVVVAFEWQHEEAVIKMFKLEAFSRFGKGTLDGAVEDAATDARRRSAAQRVSVEVGSKDHWLADFEETNPTSYEREAFLALFEKETPEKHTRHVVESQSPLHAFHGQTCY